MSVAGKVVVTGASGTASLHLKFPHCILIELLNSITYSVITLIAGIVGGGIAKAFLDAGARVVAPARSDSSKSKVLEFLGNSDRLYIPIVDVYSLSGAESLAKYITVGNLPTLSPKKLILSSLSQAAWLRLG